MKFHDRMFEMAGKGDAFIYRGHEEMTYTVVPTGKYAGVWLYNKKRKRLTYEFALPQVETEVFIKRGLLGKRRVLPLPARIYDMHKVNHKVFHKLHQEQGEKLSKVCYRWKALASTKLKPIEELSTQVTHLLSGRPCNRRIIQMSIAILGPQFLQYCAENPKRVLHVSDWLTHKLPMLSRLGVQKRYSFLKRVYVIGTKKALKKSFPKMHPRTANELAGDCVINWSGDPRFWTKLRKPVPASCIPLIEGFTRCASDGKDRQELAQIVAAKYGYMTLASLSHCDWELMRMHQCELEFEHDIFGQIQKQHVYEAWHQQMADRVRDYYEILHSMKEEELEEKHRTRWANLQLTDGIKPLVTLADFSNEGEKMKHCVSGYFRAIGSICAHVEYKGEQATVELNSSNPSDVVQLRGVCNNLPSSEMVAYVNSWVASLKE